MNIVRDENKLVFAAASNTGGNGSRTWPANQVGVFCIHAANERGTVDPDMNPHALAGRDNFATYGCGIESYWNGHYRSISGTSFATPIAAAIAANIIDIARRKLPSHEADELSRYKTMKDLFRTHMTDNHLDGRYHYIKPWKEGLWDQASDADQVVQKLQNILTFSSREASRLNSTAWT